MLKFLFYILIIWFLVRVISRFFMPRVQSRQRGRQSMLYQIISQLQNQARNNGSGSRKNDGQTGTQSSQQKSRSSKNKNLDDIEEAEFEDITDDDQK